MAIQGEEAAKTRANMLMWAEFTYKVGTGRYPEKLIFGKSVSMEYPNFFQR